MTKPSHDRYKCPDPGCQRWLGQHLTTGLLARHNAPGERYTLCGGSLAPLKGLISSGGAGAFPPYQSPYTQARLF
jgi:hypothetical protein